MKGCYKAAANSTLPPVQVTLEQIMAEQVDLYHQVPPPRDNIPIPVDNFQVDDLVPMDGEIEGAVRRLRSNRSGGPSRMRGEHLRGWMWEARKAEAAASVAVEKAGDT